MPLLTIFLVNCNNCFKFCKARNNARQLSGPLNKWLANDERSWFLTHALVLLHSSMAFIGCSLKFIAKEVQLMFDKYHSLYPNSKTLSMFTVNMSCGEFDALY